MTPFAPVILFVINPQSGSRSGIDWQALIREHFRDSGHDLHFQLLDASVEASVLEQRIEKLRPVMAVAVGGDGTVSFLARLLLGTGITLGILPAGSANGMARELAIPEDPAAALEVLSAGNSRLTDVIRINKKHICLHLSDIGLNATLIKHFEEGNLRGKLGYASKIIKTLWTQKEMWVDIATNGQPSTHRAFMVVLANATRYGTGAVINPEGDLSDGRFEVIIIHRLAISELFKMLLGPRPFNPEKISVYQATSVSIRTTRKMHFQVDGEYLGRTDTIEAEILAGKLRLQVPVGKQAD
ncbi:MAG: diacylglycerol kinase family protein [Candidatus Pseudobacter hemicellulosilyticus]|uniref:Diacylglycerol kinase family protein n=1 Tax=Candidatus Pseudobacter hemicellulosilyticus TaxID=3121375 RepID=A0AAJ5WT60_9BACT|nr:MAG: diacylglycerol kinase family protein [Pseudobacter sp.]